MMPSHDYLSLIKRQAKLLAKTKSIKLSAAQASIASSGGFDHYHELQQVAKNSPNDIRLMRLALQTDDLAEVIYEEHIYSQIDPLLENELSSQIALTNAEGFYIDELVVEEAEYGLDTGVLSINADISYTGDQMPDRPYSGTAFKLKVVINLFRQVSQWEFWDDEAFQIISAVSDQELDWQEQQLEIDIARATAALPSAADIAMATAALPSMYELEKIYRDIERLRRRGII